MTEKTCFVISPIGEQDSLTRKRADDVYNYVIHKVVEPLGYTTIRADGINKSGLITPEIIKHLMEDSLVIAYLAEDNPNVFFELAIRYVTKKAYIQLKEPSQQIPFDFKDARIIELDTTELKSVEEAKERLKEQIESIGEVTPNPITAAMDQLTIQGSLDPNKAVLAEINSALSEIREAVSGTWKMPAEQEAELRVEIYDDTARRLMEPMNLLRAEIAIFQTNVNLPNELKEEVKKIEQIYNILFGINRVLTSPGVRMRKYAAMKKWEAEQQTQTKQT